LKSMAASGHPSYLRYHFQVLTDPRDNMIKYLRSCK